MVLWISQLNDEHMDWFDEEDLNGIEQIEQEAVVSDVDIPIINVENYMNKDVFDVL